MDASPSLPQLIDSYLTWYFSENPALAQMLGAAGYDGRLGDFGAHAQMRREREAGVWLERFEAVPAADRLEDEIDRQLAVSQLRGRRLLAEWPSWRRDPAEYLSTALFSLLMPYVHRLHPEPDLVEDTLGKLAEIPEVLAACRGNLDPELAAPLIVERGAGQSRTARAFLTSSLPGLVGDERLAERVRQAAEPAAAAFDQTTAFLEDLRGRAHGDWRMGERLYSALLTEREMLGYGAAELHERGRRAYDALDVELRGLSRAITGDCADWRALIATLQDDHPPTLEAMRAEYEAETERARAFARERGIVTFADGEQCRVVPSPEFQRPILAVASYMPPPALTTSRTGHFFVPYAPADFNEDQVRQRLATNSRAQIPTIAVHEAYPGHHWHLSWSAGSPRTLRKVHRTPYFSEGWALYVETVMRDEGYFTDPRHELAHVEARAFRAARIVVDTALHCGDMTQQEAEAFMAEKSALSPGTAKGEVSRYCAWPTQAPSYLTGCLEIERIRDEYLSRGLGSRRAFHDTIAGSGSLPLGLARAAALGGFAPGARQGRESAGSAQGSQTAG
ncbi:DUF885 domain-containing protein [Actinocrinis puniceicyclus]|uniref:DUF885 domain-containing protein n=1 Tax=Actinocrinis puniceicyclus TaxID=977794 RepID=A0A8J7WL46_9ACTN|nr:DUF885 domain-containing protein [Actinocrinis puniceicyclus]MBS2964351.1 DUF885 domain-containing protein [Actinocrinis puniceicyclus]